MSASTTVIRVVTRARFIKNINTPSCNKCIFFEPAAAKSTRQPKCNKFGEKNIITGNVSFETAQYCRHNENMCGESGHYFIQNSASHPPH